MSKPEDVPSDIWEAADKIVAALVDATIAAVKGADEAQEDDGLINAYIARAILAERERCAMLVEFVGSDVDPPLADHLAAAIRRGEG